MDVKLEDILGKNDQKYIRILRLLHLIEGVNMSMENSGQMNSALMLRQCQHQKKEYTKELLELLEDYNIPLKLAEAA